MQQHKSLSEERTHEREVLEELVRSEGWAVFVERVLNEWKNEGYFARMNTAITSGDPLQHRVIHQTSLEVQKMLAYPKARIQYLGGKGE